MLTNAFNTATAGLQALQVAIGTVSQNVANAGVAGYTKRAVSTISSGDGNSGVAATRIDRVFEEMALKQVRLETSQAAYASVKAEILAQIDKLNGKPGESTALDARLNGFARALQGLTTNSTSASVRNTVLTSASILADKIRSMADTLEAHRSGIEKRTAAEVSAASGLLASIASLNVKAAATSDNSVRAGILDQRDGQITQLARYMEVKQTIQRDGSATLMTGSGLVLVDHGAAATLAFDVGAISATLPAGGRVNLDLATIGSGSISAGVELRDVILPRAQRRLDDLAFGLAQAFTDRNVTAVQGRTGFELRVSDLANIKPGNTITISLGSGDAVRNVVLVASRLGAKGVDARQTVDSGARAQTFTIPANPATSQGYADAISAALAVVAPSMTVATSNAGTLIFSGAGIQGMVAAVTEPRSAGDFSGGFPRMALFVEGTGNSLVTGSLDDGSQRVGLARRLAVNAALVADTSPLAAVSKTSSDATGARPQFLYDALTASKQTFSSASGVGGMIPYTATVMSFAQDVVAAAGAEAAAAKTVNEQQSAAKADAEAWFAKGASVNLDEEMSRLIALQTAYSANARVLTASREMLDLLLRA
ncbi:flagellar hook-associated protein FlgK [Bradyrhizobium sp. SZCCHNPS2010]|uniref:flagellar hook-associated protein FlgK n=1 Tax=Bradyrhizobium sp. SZCCHNPS2010 TaxID=3057333 RepID=UPI0029161E74|nr:flagellar hook-associated protein FlgK [Bradyrhizobium sp. SZCCHNPS2010]